MNLPGVKSALPDALARLMEAHALPAPQFVDLAADPVVVQLASPAHVRAWADCLKVAPAKRVHVMGEGTGTTYALVHLVGCLLRLQADGDAPTRAAKGRTRTAAGRTPGSGLGGRTARGESRKDTIKGE